MRIMVRYYGWVTYQTDKHGEEFTAPDQTTVRQLLSLVEQKYGPKIRRLCFPFGEDDRVMITINRSDLNDKQLFPQGLDTEIKQGDVVGFIGPRVAGG